MKSWLITIIGLLGAWYYTDLASKSNFYGVLCPILAGLFLVILIVKIVAMIGPENGRGSGDGGGGFFDGGFGGDGGCGGD
ncbi:hypothetical protein [Simiduia aestuariiviva]|uniref:Uncharacterized protein n=1 Tax=Simiduia aestuariiviva TaxID=1510459 RepID=A0A839USL9_9GAMM|nr:hypothetical protein [Simiduia aestuariiviva]MBB3169439.1 hypothetical protein [Simiduia aestuariiviva]